MNLGFWGKLKKPLMVLAPMADVTDAAFRQIIARYSRPQGPDVFWTEFVSADGLMSVGRDKLLIDLKYTEAERPIVAQLFGANPEKMEGAARLVAELGFDGLDLNFGCPDRSIEKQGAGAALMKNPKLAREIIRAAKRGACPEQGRGTKDIPISVKTRLGYNKDELETWLPEILAEEPAVVTIHCRTRKEMSKVRARWERVKRAVEIRNELGSKTLIFGNGDLRDLADARAKVKEAGADGAMLGRAIFGNPWLFAEESARVTLKNPDPRSNLKMRLQVMVEHTKLFEELFGSKPVQRTGRPNIRKEANVLGKNFSIMKKHFKAYVSGWEGASELRAKLMQTNSAAEVEGITKTYLAENNLT